MDYNEQPVAEETEVDIPEEQQLPPQNAGQPQEPPAKKKLYDKLHQSELYTKSYEDFDKQFSSPQSIDKLYSKLNEKQLYTKSKDDFHNQFFKSSQAEAQNMIRGTSPQNKQDETPQVNDYMTAKKKADSYFFLDKPNPDKTDDWWNKAVPAMSNQQLLDAYVSYGTDSQYFGKRPVNPITQEFEKRKERGDFPVADKRTSIGELISNKQFEVGEANASHFNADDSRKLKKVMAKAIDMEHENVKQKLVTTKDLVKRDKGLPPSDISQRGLSEKRLMQGLAEKSRPEDKSWDKLSEDEQLKAIDDFVAISGEKKEDVYFGFDDGDYDYKNGKIVKKGGFGDMFSQSFRTSLQDIDLGLKMIAHEDNPERQKYELAQNKIDREHTVEYHPDGLMGKAGEVTGGVAPYAIAGVLLPEADIAAMGLSGAGANSAAIWNNPNMTDEEKIKAVNDTKGAALGIGAAQGYFMGKGAKGAMKPIVGSVYKDLSTLASTTAKDVLKAAAIGGGGQLSQNIFNIGNGVRQDVLDNVGDAALGLAGLDLMFKSFKILPLASRTLDAAREKFNSKVFPEKAGQYQEAYNNTLATAASAPDEVYHQGISELEAHPDKTAADQTVSSLEELRKFHDELPSHLTDIQKTEIVKKEVERKEILANAENIKSEPVKKAEIKKAETVENEMVDMIMNPEKIDKIISAREEKYKEEQVKQKTDEQQTNDAGGLGETSKGANETDTRGQVTGGTKDAGTAEQPPAELSSKETPAKEINPKVKPAENVKAQTEGEQSVPNETATGGGEPPKDNPPVAESESPRFDIGEKSMLNRLFNSEKISESTKEKFKDKLTYKPQSYLEARALAKDIVKEYGEDAVSAAEAGRFDGDVNSMIFAETLDKLHIEESKATDFKEKQIAADKWADVAMRYDELARQKGKFISGIQDFYKKSPLGIKVVEGKRRDQEFKKFFKNKEANYKEVFEELIKEPEFEPHFKEKVSDAMKEERATARAARKEKVHSAIDKAISQFKDGATYATIIPPKVITAALEGVKKAYDAGEAVVKIVEDAIDYISKEISGEWDKEKFRKEWETKLEKLSTEKIKRTPEELSIEKQEKIIEKFRKKLKGLSDKEKEEVIRRSFKTLVENGALEYTDFKQIIKDAIGLGELTPEQSKRITELVVDINAVDELGVKAREDRSEATLQAYRGARKKAEKSATELGELVYNQPNILRRILGIMQLNTLGIPSLINNPIFNIWNQATVRFPIGIQLTALDQIIYGASKVSHKLLGTDVILPENNVFAGQGEFWKKLGHGTKESGEQLINGMTNKDYFQKEVYTSQIHPLTSLKDLWSFAIGKKKLSKGQIADKALQGTVGIPAEIVARVLNIGDKPQRYAAEGSQAAVFAKQLGLKGIDYRMFMEFPKEEAYRAYKKRGMSEVAAMKKAEQVIDRIIKQGEESTFQQDNLVNDMITGAFNPLGKFGAIIKTLNMPFVKIPLNAFWSVFNLVNPEVALLQSATYFAKALKTKSPLDIQQSKKWLAHATTGMALMAIAGNLAKRGIINPSNPDDTTKKERVGEKTYEQEKSINVTKLMALLNGQDPDKVTNGINVDLKWFGNVGNVMNTQAQKLEDMTPEQKKNGLSFMEDMLANAKNSTKDFMDNGIFSNSANAITAFTKGGSWMDNYLLNLMNMGTNLVQPAMFAQVSKAQLPYYTKIKADTFYEEVKNNFLSRSSTLRKLSGQMPASQVGVWGDKLERKDNTIMKLFSISSSNKDNFAQPIYEDYKRTGNTKFFPPTIKPELNHIKLNTTESETLELLVGQARKNLAAPYINGMATIDGFDKPYKELSDDEKLDALDVVYEVGFEIGKNQFLSIPANQKFKTELSEEEKDKKSDKKSNRKELRSKLKSEQTDF